MRVKKAVCIGGPAVAFSIIDEDTIQLQGETYFFDPALVEYDDIPSLHPEILFVAYEIFRDESGELNITIYQGEPV